MQTDLRGKDMVTTQEWSKPQIESVLDVADDLKREFARERWDHFDSLTGRSLFMLFYNSSTRTRNSFEAGINQLGGYAHIMTPEQLQLQHGESASRTSKVLSRYGHGFAVRVLGEAVDFEYPKGTEIVRQYQEGAEVPVFNMQCDTYHPFQTLADLQTVRERKDSVEDIDFTVSYAYAPEVRRPASVPHSSILGFTKMGANVTLAHPEGIDLDPDIVDQAEENADQAGVDFTIEHDMERAFRDADVVYPKHWVSTKVGERGVEEEKEIHDQNEDWIADEDMMDNANHDAIYMHPLPAKRGYEATDAVMEGPQSVIYDQAENRMHAQKGVMAVTMGGRGF
ncbi:MAG: ornithine carbamoyltransferase [Halobacteriales archaeon]|jgi:ornithine carbamoyltransferase